MDNTRKQKLIEELRLLREEKNITYQYIADKTAENGEAVSLSTVKKVFSDHYNHDHDFIHTLKPIANVLTSPSENDTLTTKILQIRLEYKDEMIEQLQTRIANKEKNHQNREAFLMDQLGFLQTQIEFKDSQIKRLNEAIDRKDKMIRERLL
jgi:transcriptional regulator with XRE-family HTH domain